MVQTNTYIIEYSINFINGRFHKSEFKLGLTLGLSNKYKCSFFVLLYHNFGTHCSIVGFSQYLNK
jgi:hypothetical protein